MLLLNIKANKSVYIAKSRQWYHKTFSNIFLHVPNHAWKDMYMLNYRTIKTTNGFYYSSIEMLIYFINSVIAIHVFL